MKKLIDKLEESLVVIYFLLAGVVLTYAIGSFIQSDTNVTNWGIEFRERIAILYTVYAAIILLMHTRI